MIKDKRVLKAILRHICKENNRDINNVYIHPNFGYVVTVDNSIYDVDFCKGTYKGIEYKVRYLDGCFYPYILEATSKLSFILKI